MAYQIYKFGNVVLGNIYNSVNDLSSGATIEQFVKLSGGGVHDAWGGEKAPTKSTNLTKRGAIIATNPLDFKTQLQLLKTLVGQRDKLWRLWDDGTLEWTYARLVEQRSQRQPDHISHLPVDLDFVTVSPTWYGENQQSVTADLTASPQTVVVHNAGNEPVTNAIITITTPVSLSSPITSITMSNDISGCTWTGSLVSGDILEIDCGGWSVKKNGTGAWSISFLAGKKSLLWLAPGDNEVQFAVSLNGGLPQDIESGMATGVLGAATYTDGFSVAKVTIQLDYYDSWK